MPLYEYECKQCGNRFEKIQKFSDEPEKACPKCGGAVEQMLSAPAVQFKGAGWYVTDYAKKSGGAGVKASGSEAAPTTSQKQSESPAAAEPAKPSTASSSEKKD